MDTYNHFFKSLNHFNDDGNSTTRRWIFLPRMYMTIKLLRWHFNLGYEYNPFREGLEVKYALEAAEDTGAEIKFLGNELNKETRLALFHETRFNIPEFFYKWVKTVSTKWNTEQ